MSDLFVHVSRGPHTLSMSDFARDTGEPDCTD